MMYAQKYKPATVAAAAVAAAAVTAHDGPPEEPAKKKRKARGLLGLKNPGQIYDIFIVFYLNSLF